MTVVMASSENKDGEFIDRLDASGYTALHWAVIAHHWAFAKKLIGAGARRDIEDVKGKTAKNWAEERGKIEKWNTILKEVKQEDPNSLPFSKVCVYCF